MPSKDIILEVKGLRTYFTVREGLAKAVNDVSFQLSRGETLGLVGESGCGKTVLSLSILRLLDTPPASYHGGRIVFDDQDLLTVGEAEMQQIRGYTISMIFQEPMTSLNPVMRIGRQIDEVLQKHLDLSPAAARQRAIALLGMVGIPSPARRYDAYPHQLSGGMRQRVMIAIALACDPHVLIADEPTTALDVTIQAQILDLMRQLQADLGTSILLITHDLGVIAETADRVAVMYAGRIVEKADVREIFNSPVHPYTQGLLRSIPRIDEDKRPRRLNEIPGRVPNLFMLPEGCTFVDRCPFGDDRCRGGRLELVEIAPGHHVRCRLTDREP